MCSPEGSGPPSLGSGSARLMSSVRNETWSLVPLALGVAQRAKYDLPQLRFCVLGLAVTVKLLPVRRTASLTRPLCWRPTERSSSVEAPAGRLGAGTLKVYVRASF